MTNTHQEIEVKFLLENPTRLEQRLVECGATLITPRVFEINIRFDDANNRLMNTQQVLRLRKDERIRLTYKSPAQSMQPVSIRKEVEIEVDDFDKAINFLESLGFREVIRYEKWRTTYLLGEVEVVLDELPFGHFCELEGPDASAIEQAAQKLILDWDKRCTLSYLALFSQLKAQRKLAIQNLTFSEFEAINVNIKDLGITPSS